MADEEDLKITIEPAETPADTDTTVRVDEPKRPASAEASDQFKAMQAERDRERERADQAERRAATERAEREKQAREATTARGDVIDREEQLITSGISAAQNEATAAENEYKVAFEAGDAAAMAAAQRKMARAEAKSLRLDEAKAEMETRRAAAQRAPEQRQQATPQSDFDGYLSRFTDATANWMRQHREWVTDPRKSQRLTAAHHDAMAEGLNADTPEYFEHVEKFIGVRQKAEDPNTVQVAAHQRRRTSAPVAPTQSTGGGMNGSSGNEVRLTKGEVEAATDGLTHVWNYPDPTGKNRWKKGDPIGVQEMARRKLEMTKQGVYDKSSATD